ncbi:MAG TPA: hypothetical protein VL171_03080 [Verrucomicrobiae bacterium]|nr:hypothetical protein [Verrucomicrobiae bacterium]
MKQVRFGVFGILLLGIGAATIYGQAFPTHIRLTCITTNSSGLLRTEITQRSIVNQCASDNSLDPSRLKLFFVLGHLAVIDMVTSNVVCPFATFAEDCPPDVTVLFPINDSSNKVRAAWFTPLSSDGDGLLPADFAGTVFGTFSSSMTSNSLATLKLKGKIQGGSVTNNAVYFGTLSISGKPFGLLLR